MLKSLCLVALLTSGASARQAEEVATGFWAQPALDARIDVAAFDRRLMAAAIFHETNRVRQELGLRAFRPWPRLTEAADLEAAVGRVYQPPSHSNPFLSIGTPRERVRFVGISPGRVAENIALLSVFAIDSSLGVGVEMRAGQRHFVHPQTHADLQPATYRGFAEEVVKAWMNSPGHRENLANPALLYLGCSVQPTVSLMGVDNLFCVQVFFTP